MSNFWKNKKVCVTGGAGFLGSFVLKALENRGVEDVFVPHIEDYDLTDMKINDKEMYPLFKAKM